MTPPASSRSPSAPAIRRRLLAWYDGARRDLPWRASEGSDPDAYRVWVSEVMLQQTRAGAVAPYFEAWVRRFPTVERLARADREEVLEAWSGLGYYARARNLHRAATIVRDRYGGALPREPEALRALPGIGEYTAGAIASIAFGQRQPAVDGNARRVLARLYDIASPSASQLRRRASRLVDPVRPGDFNQALMELGATICLPRSPSCPACPLAALCRARERGTVARRPAAHRRPPAPVYRIGAAVVTAGTGRVLVARRPERGLLGGMWEFPGRIARSAERPSAASRRAARALLGPGALGFDRPTSLVALVRHAYSHRRHEYHAHRFPLAEEPPLRDPASGGWTDAVWAAPDELDRLPLPAAQRRIAAAFLSASSAPARPARRRS